jgi:hypothetical protein
MNFRIVPTKRGRTQAWGIEQSAPGHAPVVIQEFWDFGEAEAAIETLRSIAFLPRPAAPPRDGADR